MKINKVIKKNALPSFCSSNSIVLSNLIKFCKFNNLPILIESTSNQVNQFGGYSKKTPNAFIKTVKQIARKENFNLKKIFFGGDHLGPLPWKNYNSQIAMKNSLELVKSYLKAGYNKIHLDTSIKCLDDKKINNQLVYNRTSFIFKKLNLKKYVSKVFFVFGTEVPLSGGNDTIKIIPTSIKQIKNEFKGFRELLNNKKKYFALVIEPGMKFMHQSINKPNLKNFKKKKFFSQKNNFTYEAHSSDYQSLKTLKNLVKNNFKFLKVGPELTYQLTKSLIFMESLEKKLVVKKSFFTKILFRQMKKNNSFWLSYFNKKNKTSFKNIIKSKFDRTRYYLEDRKVLSSINLLKKNINKHKIQEIIQPLLKKDLKLILNIKNQLKLSNFESISYLYLNSVFAKYYIASGFKINLKS